MKEAEKNGAFVLLTEKEAMWAEMLSEALQDNGVPSAAVPVLGAGLSLKTGMPERLKIFVPEEKLDAARDVVEALFPTDDEQA